VAPRRDKLAPLDVRLLRTFGKKTARSRADFARAHRLAVQDVALSRRKQGFDSPWARQQNQCNNRRAADLPLTRLETTLMATGTVKWFNPTKGYGFIQPQAGGKDVFVHISAVERAGLSTLNEGQQIEYEVVANRGKESAENLKVR
jgi:cold shock protein